MKLFDKVLNKLSSVNIDALHDHQHFRPPTDKYNDEQTNEPYTDNYQKWRKDMNGLDMKSIDDKVPTIQKYKTQMTTLKLGNNDVKLRYAEVDGEIHAFGFNSYNDDARALLLRKLVDENGHRPIVLEAPKTTAQKNVDREFGFLYSDMTKTSRRPPKR